MGFRGRDGVLRYESSWTTGSDVPGTPTWVNVAKAIDVSFAGDRGEADVSSRESDWAMDLGALKSASITVGYRQETADETVFTKLKDSWLNGTPILIQYLNGTTTGDDGWQMPAQVTGYSEEQPNTGGASASFTLKFTYAVDSSAAIIEPSRVNIS